MLNHFCKIKIEESHSQTSKPKESLEQYPIWDVPIHTHKRLYVRDTFKTMMPTNIGIIGSPTHFSAICQKHKFMKANKTKATTEGRFRSTLWCSCWHLCDAVADPPCLASIEEVLELFELMKSQLQPVSLLSYVAVMSVCGKSGQWQQSLRFFEEIPKAQVQHSVVSWHLKDRPPGFSRGDSRHLWKWSYSWTLINAFVLSLGSGRLQDASFLLPSTIESIGKWQHGSILINRQADTRRGACSTQAYMLLREGGWIFCHKPVLPLSGGLALVTACYQGPDSRFFLVKTRRWFG